MRDHRTIRAHARHDVYHQWLCVGQMEKENETQKTWKKKREKEKKNMEEVGACFSFFFFYFLFLYSPRKLSRDNYTVFP